MNQNVKIVSLHPSARKDEVDSKIGQLSISGHFPQGGGSELEVRLFTCSFREDTVIGRTTKKKLFFMCVYPYRIHLVDRFLTVYPITIGKA